MEHWLNDTEKKARGGRGGGGETKKSPSRCHFAHHKLGPEFHINNTLTIQTVYV